MSKHIIEDDCSKVRRKVIKEFVGFYISVVAIIIVCIAAFGWDKLSGKMLVISIVLLISLIVFASIMIYLRKYYLEVYEDKIELSTLFHKYTIYLNDITAFYYKKSETSEITFFTIIIKRKEIKLFTEYGKELIDLLNTSISDEAKLNSLSKEQNKNVDKFIKVLSILTCL